MRTPFETFDGWKIMSPWPTSFSAPFESRMTRESACDDVMNAMRDGDVRLDQPGDDVHRRALRRHHEVDADRAGHLRDAADRVLDVARRHHHQVGQLVDDHQHVREAVELALLAGRDPERALVEPAVVALDVAHPDRRRASRSASPSPARPTSSASAACFGCTITGVIRCGRSAKWLSSTRFGSISTSFTSSGVLAHQHRRDERVDEARLAGAGRAGDQQVRHLGQVHHDRAAVDVLAERHVRAASWRRARPSTAARRRASRSRGPCSAPRRRSPTCRGSAR